MKFKIEDNRLTASTGFGQISVSPDDRAGFRPFELFLSSLAGCSGSILRNILDKKRHLYERLEMDVSCERNPERANSIEKITVRAHIFSETPLCQEQADKIAELTVKNCGMLQSVIDAIHIDFIVEFVPLTGEKD